MMHRYGEDATLLEMRPGIHVGRDAGAIGDVPLRGGPQGVPELRELRPPRGSAVPGSAG
ncbi:hypothetical protein SBV1_1070004 [Verrucomicrobia bacterium]|nr:hypothetical protein SBV1_1070004 [Verrucomicrobiota bacterium]